MIPYLTIDEVAEALGLGPVEVHRLLRSGRLAGIYRAAEPHWLVRRDELAAFMDEDQEAD